MREVRRKKMTRAMRYRRRQRRVKIASCLLVGLCVFGIYEVHGAIKNQKEDSSIADTEESLLVESTETSELADVPEFPYASGTLTITDPVLTDTTVHLNPAPGVVEQAEEKYVETVALSDAADPLTAADDSKYSFISSSYMVLVDLDENTVVAERSADTVISPASMTKILTVLTAADYIRSLDDTVTISQDVIDYVYKNDCSAVGLQVGDTVTVRDLLNGTILCSGADAAIGLACYCAGDVDSFVALMNQKCEELGISDTAHFTNPVGIYDDNLRCTVTDMAMILEAAVQNDLCREILSNHQYTVTTSTGTSYDISNLFLRRIEDRDTDGTVLCAKTGFVNQAGSCAASYLISNSGKHYICVTGNSDSAWRAVFDHVAVYRAYTK